MQFSSVSFRCSDDAILSDPVQLCRRVFRGCSSFQAEHDSVTSWSMKMINMNWKVSGKL